METVFLNSFFVLAEEKGCIEIYIAVRVFGKSPSSLS